MIGYLIGFVWIWAVFVALMGSGVGCGYGQGVEGVESGVRVLWVEGLVPWRRKSPKKIVDERESEIEWCFLS